jgi:hypothetical protein
MTSRRQFIQACIPLSAALVLSSCKTAEAPIPTEAAARFKATGATVVDANEKTVKLFIKLRWSAAVNKLPLNVSRIIPGDWGKVGPGWLARPLLRRGRKIPIAEAGFTSSSGGVRASSVNAKKGLSGEGRLEAAPNRVK